MIAFNPLVSAAGTVVFMAALYLLARMGERKMTGEAFVVRKSKMALIVALCPL